MKGWLKSITPWGWFRLIWGTLIWLAITIVFLVPRYEYIRANQATAFDILILLICVALPLMLLFPKIDIFGIKLEHWKKEPFTADEKVPPPKTVPFEYIVDFAQESGPVTQAAQGTRTFLSLRARIHFTHEAGFNSLMRVKANNHVLTEKHIVNKDKDAVMSDGRKFSWFNSNDDAWLIPYSPDFKSIYSHSKYRVVNSDAYLFLFDLSSISPDRDGKYTLKVQHTGKTGNEAFKNNIVVRDIVTF